MIGDVHDITTDVGSVSDTAHRCNLRIADWYDQNNMHVCIVKWSVELSLLYSYASKLEEEFITIVAIFAAVCASFWSSMVYYFDIIYL